MLNVATRLLRRGRKAVVDAPTAPTGPLPPSAPVLVVLVPNIVGIGSFRLHTFHDVADAQAFLPTVPVELQAGVLAFWALHKQPPLDNTALLDCGEALVALRSPSDRQTVYVVTFVNIETAESFARFEVQRGLNLDLVMLYWASLVNIIGTEDGVLIRPATPPGPDAPPDEAPPSADEMKLLEAEIEAELRARRKEAARRSQPAEREPLEPAPAIDMRDMEVVEGQAFLRAPVFPEDASPSPGTQLLPTLPAGEQPDPRQGAREVLNTIAPVDGATFLEIGPLDEEAVALTLDQQPEALVVTQQPVFEHVIAQAPQARRILPPNFEVTDGRSYLEVQPLPEDALAAAGEGALSPLPAGPQPHPRDDARTVLDTIEPLDGAAFLEVAPLGEEAMALTRGQAPAPLVVTQQPVFEDVIARRPEGRIFPLPEYKTVDSVEVAEDERESGVEASLLPPVLVTRQPVAEEIGKAPVFADGERRARKAKNKRESEEASADGADALDAATLLGKVFAMPRWEKREEPFRGFDSPPGRF